jgi:YD repeat-containing protein
MNLSYTITRTDDREAQRIYYSWLAPSSWISRLGTPFGLTALGLGIYAYVTHNLGLAFSLFGCCLLLLVKVSLPQFLRSHFGTSKNLNRHFEIDVGDHGIIFRGSGDDRSLRWTDFRKYCETPQQFLLLSSAVFIIPKRILNDSQTAELRQLLSRKLPPIVLRTGTLALRHVLSMTVLGIMAFVFFGGTIQRAGQGLLQPLSLFLSPSQAVHLRYLPAAPTNQLRGEGRVFLIPFGTAGPLITPALLQYYKDTYGFALELKPTLPVPEWARDRPRNQLVAEELVEAMKAAYPELARDRRNVLIGLTDEDVYITVLDWQFALNYRSPLGGVVISAARLNPMFYGDPPDPALVSTRLRKLLTKNIGATFYHLSLNSNPASVLYDDVETMTTLDGMAETYNVADVRAQRDPRDLGTYPCLIVRHYLSAEKQRPDAVSLGGCSSTHGQTSLEVLNLDLSDQLVLSRRTDFYIPGKLPLELSRVIRTNDARPRAFGVGGNHSLNIFPVGNRWPFTWIDVILEDGGRLHYSRVNWGAAYWDAEYRVQSTISDFYSSSLRWKWPGWRLQRLDGRTYIFPDGDGVQRPEQAALIEVSGRDGNTLHLNRVRSGDLASVDANDGRWIHLQYDQQGRITAGQDSQGCTMSYQYSRDGYLEKVEDGNHRVMDYGHDASHRLNSLSVNGVLVWKLDFDRAGHIAELIVGNHEPYRFSYQLDRSGAVSEITVTEPSQHVFRIVAYQGRYKLLDFPSSIH